MPKLADMTGKKVGRLRIIRRSGTTSDGRAKWLCVCECGTKKEINGKTIRSGGSLSCGCLHKESSINNLPKNKKCLGYKRTVCKGYIEIKTDNGWVREHVHAMELSIGRRLTGDEVVHHRDEDKQNNCLENLELMTNGEHTAYHNRKRSAERRKEK